ncbi:MAG: amidohydrolase [Chloroflexota bacterium]|nr:MAG: amidohydrolase [Chloroflexota bacterium]
MAVSTLALRTIAEQVVLDRRHLHAHPELRYQEHETARFVAERLRAHGIAVQTGIAETGVLGVLQGGRSGKTILLRADMDALPIEEQNDVPYRSTVPGVMHACGHDGHTAILLGVARRLSERRATLAGTIKFAFQPAEEGGFGGQKMVEQGVLDNPVVDAVFGLHLMQDMEVGTVVALPGPSLAAADRFIIRVQGKGGHAAAPHQCIDATLIAANITVALNQIVSREVKPLDPAVITVGMSHSGTAQNIIADTADLRGTVRTYDPELRQRLARRIQEVALGIASAMGGSATCEYSVGYPPTVNEPVMTAMVADVVRERIGPDRLIDGEPRMGAEDFSYFLEKKPGCYFWLGTRNEERGLIWGNHHPKFDIDEAALPIGIDLLTAVAERYLAS